MDAMDARAARDARDAMAAMDAIRRFAAWCLQAASWWWWYSDLSWLATTHIGAAALGLSAVDAWAAPIFEAYCSGAWILYWTEDTLYWASKPTVHVERLDGGRRLHQETGPAMESPIEDLYFWHGVLVPDFVVMNPEKITMHHIKDEENAEVRRVMMERMGWDKFCSEAQMRVLHADELHTNFPTIPMSDYVDVGQRLVTSYRAGIEKAELLEAEGLLDFEDRPLRFVRLTDPSTGRQYTIRVLHNHARCYEAVGWTFGMSEDDYKNKPYLRQGDVMLQPLTDHHFNQQHS